MDIIILQEKDKYKFTREKQWYYRYIGFCFKKFTFTPAQFLDDKILTLNTSPQQRIQMISWKLFHQLSNSKTVLLGKLQYTSISCREEKAISLITSFSREKSTAPTALICHHDMGQPAHLAVQAIFTCMELYCPGRRFAKKCCGEWSCIRAKNLNLPLF